MTTELLKRILTSFAVVSLLALVFFYNYILIISLIIISLISWIEFSSLISKIYKKDNSKVSLLKLSIKVISLFYLILFSVLIFKGISQVIPNFKVNILYLFSICVCSDVGGLIFGKIFKGKKLTKISPNKTISGSIGSFVLSLTLVPIFYYFFDKFYNLFDLIFIAIVVSFTCQLGDLFISYLKRKAKVKDTSNILPGHGGILDRIDGMLFALPVGIFVWKILISI